MFKAIVQATGKSMRNQLVQSKPKYFLFFLRHLIKSILILIPLFGLHSLFVMWVFYHKNQGHTIWYYIAVIFKAVFGDLQVRTTRFIFSFQWQKQQVLFLGFFHFVDLLLFQYGNSSRSSSTNSTKFINNRCSSSKFNGWSFTNTFLIVVFYDESSFDIIEKSQSNRSTTSQCSTSITIELSRSSNLLEKVSRLALSVSVDMVNERSIVRRSTWTWTNDSNENNANGQFDITNIDSSVDDRWWNGHSPNWNSNGQWFDQQHDWTWRNNMRYVVD